MELPPSNIKAIATAVYFEARSEPMVCQVLVASVVKNRMKDSGKPARKVISKKNQFTWYRHISHLSINEEAAYSKAIAVAKFIESFPDVSDYRYFHNGRSGDFVCGKLVFNTDFK